MSGIFGGGSAPLSMTQQFGSLMLKSPELASGIRAGSAVISSLFSKSTETAPAPASPASLDRIPVQRLVSSPTRDLGSGTRDTIKTTPAGVTKRKRNGEEPLGPSEATSVYIPRLTAA
jgi:hypothetical protein